MSTATIDAPESTRRTPAARRPTSAATAPKLVEARQHAETAVSDLVSAATDTVRAFVPGAMLRPTDAVEFSFDLAEQVLAVCRRACVEAASVVENGIKEA